MNTELLKALGPVVTLTAALGLPGASLAQPNAFPSGPVTIVFAT